MTLLWGISIMVVHKSLTLMEEDRNLHPLCRGIGFNATLAETVTSVIPSYSGAPDALAIKSGIYSHWSNGSDARPSILRCRVRFPHGGLYI